MISPQPTFDVTTERLVTIIVTKIIYLEMSSCVILTGPYSFTWHLLDRSGGHKNFANILANSIDLVNVSNNLSGLQCNLVLPMLLMFTLM